MSVEEFGTVEEQYAAIGRFIVEFERCCGNLKFSIWQYLSSCGLKNQRLAWIMLDGKQSTASQLIGIYDAMTTELGFRENEVQKSVFDQISKSFVRLIEIRNFVAHAHWFIGYSNSPDVAPKMQGLKGNPRKKIGMDFDAVPSFQDLKKSIQEARELSDVIMMAFTCLISQVTSEGKGKFENNFAKDPEGKWQPKNPKNRSTLK